MNDSSSTAYAFNLKGLSHALEKDTASLQDAAEPRAIGRDLIKELRIGWQCKGQTKKRRSPVFLLMM